MDGFSVAQQYKDKHPEGYTFFSSKSFPSEYIEAGQHHMCMDTIFRHNPETGGLTQFRSALCCSGILCSRWRWNEGQRSKVQADVINYLAACCVDMIDC